MGETMTILLGRKPKKNRSRISLMQTAQSVRPIKKSRTGRLKPGEIVHRFRNSCLKAKSTPPPELNETEQLDRCEMNDLRGALYSED